MTNILIDSDKKLHNLLSKIEDCKEIGLDTEFIRESTYCLLYTSDAADEG